MKDIFKKITGTTHYQSWWEDELKFQKRNKFGIKIFDEWVLEPIFDKRIDFKDYNEEFILVSEQYYAYIYKYEYNLCVYLSNYEEAECYTFINNSDYTVIGFWGVDDTEDLTAVFDNYFYVFKEGEFYGYKDFNGNIIIDPVYRDFNENYLISSFYDRDKKFILKDEDNKWGAVKIVVIRREQSKSMYLIIGYKFETVIDFDNDSKETVITKLEE